MTVPRSLDRDFVRGLVIANPLRQPQWRDDPARHDSGLRGLEDLENLICFLGDFHPVDDGRRYRYVLEYIDVARTSEGALYHPYAIWEYADDDGADPLQDRVPGEVAGWPAAACCGASMSVAPAILAA